MKESHRKTHEYIIGNWENAVVDATNQDEEWYLPFPFVPPCLHGLFRCLYYWDTFFTNKGMIADGKTELAKNNTSDLLYMLSLKGYVPNAWSEMGTTYCSQPPYLHFMVRDVYEATGDKEWLKNAYFLLKKEYEFWQSERMTALGLNRHFHMPLPKEKLISYYDYVTKERLHVAWEKTEEEKAEIAEHYVAVAESGQDWSPRFHDKCADIIPVDLNANLYGLERDLAQWAELFEPDEVSRYEAAYRQRKKLMDKYCLNEDGTYHDYHYAEKKQNPVAFSGQFMPFITGMLSDQNAARALLRKLLAAHGVTSTEKSEMRGAVYQWAYPNSWAPDNYLAYEALKKCGLHKEAGEVAVRYMDNVSETYHRTGALWEKYDGVKGGAATQTEHEMTQMLGWTGGVFSYFFQNEYGER